MKPNTIPKTYILEALNAYYAGELLERGFAKMNLIIMENEHYMKLADFPHSLCVEYFCMEFGFSEDDERSYDNMGHWFTQIISDVAEEEKELCAVELYDLCISEIKEIIESGTFNYFNRAN